ncbi:MAG: molybdopterin-synthase adenylyltransferase MoeB, partial [Gammaproteobacteria bacterium]|nr:molybdopterin-synthase adenylyltransferase MoeB [Gammaproteobacteria bacterium]
CASGKRSRIAVERLRAAGLEARSLAGGLDAWRAAGLPVSAPATVGGLDATQLERYSRHLRLTEIGLQGQRKLRAAKVVCVGAGGLGSPAALYLAAAGVGELGIVDDDVVELSNLQRQVLHTTASIGRPKTESAAEMLAALNPDVRVTPYRVRLTAENAPQLLARYDVIVDASDNFATRYAIADAALALGRPVIHAAIQGFEGQLTAFGPQGRPCYRCLFPTPPPADAAPSCEEAGVLGVLPGILGTLQAAEALKLVLGIGEPLAGRLVLLDALALRFHELEVAADPACVCAPSRRAAAPLSGSPGR